MLSATISTTNNLKWRLTGRPLLPWVSSLFVLYLLAVRVCRYRRVQELDREHVNRKSKLTPAQAQKIIRVPVYLDMPFLTRRATEFALFKTYGIPTISRQLNKTKQLAKKETSSKRFVDTAVLISTFVACPISGPGSGATESDTNADVDPRSAIAIARINWLHAHYNISNEDFLYTLSVFIYEPVRWNKEFGWRSFSRLECDALYTFWAEIGRRMSIKHIPPNFDDFQKWSERYERDHMVPDENNAIVADKTIGLLLHKVPSVLGLKSFGRKVVICLLGERLRKAMMLPEQPVLLVKFVRGLLQSHGFFCRHFSLPRRIALYYVRPNCPLDSKRKGGDSVGPPRAHPEYYTNDPWYTPESTGLRRLLEKIQIAAGVAKPEHFPGPHFQSEGYRLEELGPMYFSKLDHDKVMKMAETIQGAPVQGPWSLDYTGGCPMGTHS